RGDLVVGQLRGLLGREHRVLPRRDLPLHLPRDGLVGALRDIGDDLHRVGRVEDRELRLEPAVLGLLADDAHAQRVKGAQRQALGRAPAHQACDALLHLPSGLVGEGDGGDVGRAEPALLDQPRDLVRDHARLAAAGAGEHQTGTVEIADGFALRGVELGGHVSRFYPIAGLWRRGRNLSHTVRTICPQRAKWPYDALRTVAPAGVVAMNAKAKAPKEIPQLTEEELLAMP